MSVTAYDARADEYIAALGSMDAVHPVDRAIVDAWASSLDGPVLDAGCGPGHWTRYLAGLGLDVRGVDLAPRFIAHARASYPGIRFDVGNIDDLEVATASVGGILSWFSTIHHDPDTIDRPLRQFARALRPGGRLLLGFFHGPATSAFEHAVVRAFRWPADELGQRADAAGFDVIETQTRETYGERPVATLLCQRRP